MLYRTFLTQHEIDQEYNPRMIVNNFELTVKNYFTEILIINYLTNIRNIHLNKVLLSQACTTQLSMIIKNQ